LICNTFPPVKLFPGAHHIKGGRLVSPLHSDTGGFSPPSQNDLPMAHKAQILAIGFSSDGKEVQVAVSVSAIPSGWGRFAVFLRLTAGTNPP
jgi:hypothetical protein